MNAALQCVYGTAAFKDAFMKGNWFSCTCTCIYILNELNHIESQECIKLQIRQL